MQDDGIDDLAGRETVDLGGKETVDLGKEKPPKKKRTTNKREIPNFLPEKVTKEFAQRQLGYLRKGSVGREIELLGEVSADAEGGAGIVYKARATPGWKFEVFRATPGGIQVTTEWQDIVAIKVAHPRMFNDNPFLDPASLDQNIRWLHRERELMNQIYTSLKKRNTEYNSPHYERHIVQCAVGGVIGKPAWNGNPSEKVGYLVMEYVEGRNLEEYIENHIHQYQRALNEAEALDIAIPIAIVLEEANNYEIIHRDVKPKNVMIAKDGTVKVGDFGLAKRKKDFQRPDKALVEQVVGTLGYAARQVWQGEAEGDVKLDSYSLGGTLYEMLTGRIPHTFENAKEASQPRQPLLVDDVSPGLRNLIAGLTEDQPENMTGIEEAVRELIGLRKALYH